jgi:transposase-like protein
MSDNVVNRQLEVDCPKCKEDRLGVLEAIPGKRHGYLCKSCEREYGARLGHNLVRDRYVWLATFGDDVWIVEEVDEDPADNS